MKKLVNTALIILTLSLAGGCFSLNYDFKGGVSIPTHVSSFSVQFFENRAKLVEPTFSQTITEELKEYIQSNTNLRQSNSVGDVDFSGVITDYQISPQAISSGDESAMTRFTISVKVNYRDQKDPEQNFEKSISAFREFETSTSFTSVEEELTEDIVDELIELIFNAAFVNW